METNRSFAVISRVILCLIIAISYLFSVFSTVLSAREYLIVFAIVIVLFILTKPIKAEGFQTIALLWLFAMAIMLFSYMRSTGLFGAMIDMMILAMAALMCFFPEEDERSYYLGFKLMVFFGGIHTVGVLLEQLLPNVYFSVLDILPQDLMLSLRRASGMSGFTPNTGFTAAFLCVGVIAIAALWQTKKNKKSTKYNTSWIP